MRGWSGKAGGGTGVSPVIGHGLDGHATRSDALGPCDEELIPRMGDEKTLLLKLAGRTPCAESQLAAVRTPVNATETTSRQMRVSKGGKSGWQKQPLTPAGIKY